MGPLNKQQQVKLNEQQLNTHSIRTTTQNQKQIPFPQKPSTINAPLDNNIEKVNLSGAPIEAS